MTAISGGRSPNSASTVLWCGTGCWADARTANPIERENPGAFAPGFLLLYRLRPAPGLGRANFAGFPPKVGDGNREPDHSSLGQASPNKKKKADSEHNPGRNQ